MSIESRSTDATGQAGDINTMPRLTEPTFSFAQEDTVLLVVGPEQKLLIAHESHLKLNSEFFQTALKAEWVEGQTRTINLPEDDTETMTNYLTFTYGRGLPTTSLVSMPVGGPQNGEWVLLAKLYVLGERLLDTPLRNAVVREIMRIASLLDNEGHRYFMDVGASNTCYEGTPTGSLIRRLIVDEHVSAGQKSWIDHDKDHPAFLGELSTALLDKVATRQPYDEFVDCYLDVDDYLI